MESTLTQSPLHQITADGVIRKADNYAEIMAERMARIDTCETCGFTGDVTDLFCHDCPATATAEAPRPDVALRPSDTPDRWRPRGSATPANRHLPPSQAQADLIRKLIAELGGHDDVDLSELTGGRHGTASVLITALLAEAKQRRNANQPAAPQVRRNRYAGPCRICQHQVPAEAGILRKIDGRWVVEHDGGCRTDGPPAQTQPTAPQADVPAGHYAIDSTGTNDLAFYRVDRPTEGAWAGRVFVKLIVGGHPDRNMPRSHVAGILARIAEDGPDAAGQRYGQEIGRCCRCNRTLTDEASRSAGIGPECAKAGS
jgi:uncharacterized protein DUF6011